MQIMVESLFYFMVVPALVGGIVAAMHIRRLAKRGRW